MQHHDALIAAIDAVKHLHGDVVESIPDHVSESALVVPAVR
jgi:hypothetical protein